MTQEEEKPKIDKDERHCFKCKRIVHKSDWNGYYEICNRYVETSTGR